MKTQKKHNTGAPLRRSDLFPQFLAGLEQDYASRPALSWFTRRHEEQTLTYGQLVQQVRALGEALCQQGLAGKTLAIVSENSAPWLISFLAGVCCGCTMVCIDTEQSDDSIRDMLRRAQVTAAFLSSPYLPICQPLLEADGELKQLFRLDGIQGEDTYAHLCSTGSCLRQQGSRRMEAVTILPEQTASLVFTSGTTSVSKMVLLSHRAILYNVFSACQYVDVYRKMFSSLPFYHAYGLNCAVWVPFLEGAHLYINGDLRRTMADLKQAQPDSMMAVPLMVEAIHDQLWCAARKEGKEEQLRQLLDRAALSHRLRLPLGRGALEQFRRQNLGDLRLIISGGAHLSREIALEFELLGVQILQGYGITECSPLVCVNCNDENRLGSVGRPIPGVEVRIEDGEVWVKGPCLMTGYYRDDGATAACMEEGWFRTGDLGSLDKDGFLFLTGRKKNLIVFKNGKKLSPEKLEALIASLPAVKEVVVQGTANGSSADDVKLAASIYPDPEQTKGMSSYEILDLLHKQIDQINMTLPVYQQIQMVTIREKEFSKTATQKIKRYE